ncbi:hypothetical protein AVEN_119066-1 [Araneus ventricosus]|uniref:Uncharacterized protein n=1 Tax=Araneus ventricosus TaxID=182803 RepID=A0A4Y2BMM3_ARAVE|nr:hypothetical protein AVEN_119066-1 [Araneus ventricosus]
MQQLSYKLPHHTNGNTFEPRRIWCTPVPYKRRLFCGTWPRTSHPLVLKTRLYHKATEVLYVYKIHLFGFVWWHQIRNSRVSGIESVTIIVRPTTYHTL